MPVKAAVRRVAGSGGRRPSTRRNIAYRSPHIARYYAGHRFRWSDFYPSERWIFRELHRRGHRFGHTLDVGCAGGGAGLALSRKFSLKSYTGVDINDSAIRLAESRRTGFPVPARFLRADILELKPIRREPFNTVITLSCADWNVETEPIIRSCWRRVAPKGVMIISLRLTNRKGVNDRSKSYQWVRFEGRVSKGDERANYVVFNTSQCLALLSGLRPAPSHILGFGYGGAPSRTAVTPYRRLIFSVFALTKSDGSVSETRSELHLPAAAYY